MSCKLTHTEVNGLKAIILENDLLRVGILPDRGSDIFEFYYKPKSTDFLLRLPKGIQNPNRVFSQVRSNSNQFEDYYYGGWQVCLPNSPAFNYRGAELGQHGEVSLIAWEVVTIKDSEDEVSLTLTATPLRFPAKITRTFRLFSNESKLIIEELVENISKTKLDMMWGQHIAFGLPFLADGVDISTNAMHMETEPTMPAHHLFKRGEKYDWPKAKKKDGKLINSNKVSAHGEDQYADLCYLTGMGKDAFYAIKSQEKNVGMAVQWDGELFKELWYWQERNATQDAPWWGDCYTVALEPWTSRWTDKPLEAIKQGDWLSLTVGEQRSTKLIATAFENQWKNEGYESHQ